MKLIIDIPEEVYKAYCASTYCINDMIILENEVRNGIPLDDVKAEIAKIDSSYERDGCWVMADVLKVLDNIGKVESEE